MNMDMNYTYWEDDNGFSGYLNDFPEESFKGFSLAELEDALVEVYKTRQEEKKYMDEIRKIGNIKVSA